MSGILSPCLMLATIIAVSCGMMCTREQWEGYESSIGGYDYHSHTGLLKEHNTISFDAKNKRVASFINYVNNDYENRFQMVLRYDNGDANGIMYLVDLRTGQCRTRTMKMPFPRCCIPDHGRKVHDYFLGPMGEGGLKVSGYSIKEDVGGAYLAVIVNKDNTITPVLENLRGKMGPTSYVQALHYGNITPGIKNETVFEIPEQCKHEVTDIPEYIMRRRFLLSGIM